MSEALFILALARKVWVSEVNKPILAFSLSQISLIRVCKSSNFSSDLIFLPWVRGSIETEIGAVFEVKYVQADSVFYQLGNLQTFDVSLEKFEYSNELFQTGIPILDAMTTTYSIDAKYDEITLATENGVMLMTESGIVITNDNEDKRLVDKGDTSTFFEDEAAEFIDFSDMNPFSENDF